MSVDVLSESVLTLQQAAQAIPTHPHISTLWRWYHRGCRGIRLETVIIGGKRYTSREAIQRFIEATTDAHDRGAASPTHRPNVPTTRRRRAGVKEARQRLRDAGIE